MLVTAMQKRALAGAQGRRDEMHKTSEDDDAVLSVFGWREPSVSHEKRDKKVLADNNETWFGGERDYRALAQRRTTRRDGSA